MQNLDTYNHDRNIQRLYVAVLSKDLQNVEIYKMFVVDYGCYYMIKAKKGCPITMDIFPKRNLNKILGKKRLFMAGNAGIKKLLIQFSTEIERRQKTTNKVFNQIKLTLDDKIKNVKEAY